MPLAYHGVQGLQRFRVVAKNTFQHFQSLLGVELLQLGKLGVHLFNTAKLTLAIGEIQADARAFGYFGYFFAIHCQREYFAQSIARALAAQPRLV